MPAPQDTYVDPLLTDVSVNYKNTGFIAEQIFPSVSVDKETGIYFVQDDKETLRAPADALRGEFSRANRVANKLTEATYTLKERSLETAISDRVMRNYSDPFDPKRNATELVTQKLLLSNEKEVAAILAATNATDASGAWSTTSTDIIGLARTARDTILKKTGMDANLAVIGKPAFDVILNNAAVIERIKYTARATDEVIMNAIADFLGVDRVLIGKTIENTAKEGQTASTSYVWSDNVSFLYVPASAQLETPAAGYRLVQKDQRFIDTWYEQDIKATLVRANDTFENKVVASDAIFTYTNVAA